MKKKLFTLLALCLVCLGVSASTEVVGYPSTDRESFSGTSFTAGTNEEWTNSTKTVSSVVYTKVRTNQASNTITFKVNSGYKITGISISGYSNNSSTTADRSIYLTSIKFDDTECLSSQVTLPGGTAGQTPTTASATGSATTSVVCAFDNSNIVTKEEDANGKNTQIFANITITYEVLESGAYSITCANNLTKGVILSSKDHADENDEITLTATPYPGWQLDQWVVTDASDNPVSVSENKFTMPASNVNVTATFKQTTTKIDFTSMGSTLTKGSTEIGTAYNKANSKLNKIYNITAPDALVDVLAVQATSSDDSGKGYSLSSGLKANSKGRCAAILHLTKGCEVTINANGVVDLTGGGSGEGTHTQTNSGNTYYVTMTSDGYMGFELTAGYTITSITVTGYNENDFALSANDLTLAYDGTKSITNSTGGGDITYSGSSSGAVTFESSDENVVTVDVNGVVSGVNGGTATITVIQAAAGEYMKAVKTINVTVTDTRAENNLSVVNSTISFGALSGSYTLTKGTDYTTSSNADLTFTSSNTDVATVDANGVITPTLSSSKITGTTIGSTTITISQASNESYKAATKTLTFYVMPELPTTCLDLSKNDMGTDTQWKDISGNRYYLDKNTFVISAYSAVRSTAYLTWIHNNGDTNAQSGESWDETGVFKGNVFFDTDRAKKATSARPVSFRVTNCTGASMLIQGKDANNKAILSAYEVTEGVVNPEAVKTVDTGSDNTIKAYSIDGLEASKEYLIVVSASSTDNRYFYEMEFTRANATAQTKDISITAAGWATAYLPFKATITSSNATAYSVKVENDAMVKTETTVIPAYTGILLKSTSGEAATVTFTESESTPSDVTGNQLVGTALAAGKTFNESDTKYYILAKDSKDGLGFYWQVDGGASAECAQYKAVLAIPSSASAKEGFSFEGEATGISEVASNKEHVADAIYNLNCIMVDNSYKGIVIANGKKVINK